MNVVSTGTNRESLLSEGELARIEREYPDGLSSAEIIEIFTDKGAKFSEATFRKYVQIGLLPRSRRVGSKGKHKGSRGVYPVGTVRQINEVKRVMSLGFTMEEIVQQFAFVGGEIEELRSVFASVLEKIEVSMVGMDQGEVVEAGLKKQIEAARGAADEMLSSIEEASRRIRELRQTAREAV